MHTKECFSQIFNRKDEEKKKEYDVKNDDDESGIDSDPTDSESTTSSGDIVSEIIVGTELVDIEKSPPTESESSGSIPPTPNVREKKPKRSLFRRRKRSASLEKKLFSLN